MNKKLKSDAMDGLFEAVLSLKNIDECYSFFEDVCTVNELLSFGQRYEVARMLRSGRTYLEIADKTGDSDVVVRSVSGVSAAEVQYGVIEESAVIDECSLEEEYRNDRGNKTGDDRSDELLELPAHDIDHEHIDRVDFGCGCKTEEYSAPYGVRLLFFKDRPHNEEDRREEQIIASVDRIEERSA